LSQAEAAIRSFHVTGVQTCALPISDTTASGTTLGDFGESPALQSGYLRRVGHDVCDACRNDGLLIRPLGNVVVLMPPLAISEVNLLRMGEIVVRRVREIGK